MTPSAMQAENAQGYEPFQEFISNAIFDATGDAKFSRERRGLENIKPESFKISNLPEAVTLDFVYSQVRRYAEHICRDGAKIAYPGQDSFIMKIDGQKPVYVGCTYADVHGNRVLMGTVELL